MILNECIGISWVMILTHISVITLLSWLVMAKTYKITQTYGLPYIASCKTLEEDCAISVTYIM